MLRGLAALSVVLSHTLGLQHRLPNLGPSHFNGIVTPAVTGVEFFFVLSGFVMAMTHGRDIGKPGRILPFAWARIRRLYPLLWVVLALQLIVDGAGPYPLSTWAGAALLAPMDLVAIIAVLWTLKLEVMFYVLLALSMLPVVGWVILVVWAALPPLLLVWPVADHVFGFGTTALFVRSGDPIFNATFLLFSVDFLIGLAVGLLQGRIRMSQTAAWLLAAAGAGLVCARLVVDDWGTSYGPLGARYIYGVGFGAILVGCTAAERAATWRLGRWATVLGAATYPTYLVHLLVVERASAMAPAPSLGWLTPADVLLLGTIIASVAAGLFLAYAVDRPIQRVLKQLVRTPRQNRSPAPETAVALNQG